MILPAIAGKIQPVAPDRANKGERLYIVGPEKPKKSFIFSIKSAAISLKVGILYCRIPPDFDRKPAK